MTPKNQIVFGWCKLEFNVNQIAVNKGHEYVLCISSLPTHQAGGLSEKYFSVALLDFTMYNVHGSSIECVIDKLFERDEEKRCVGDFCVSGVKVNNFPCIIQTG